MIRNGKPYVPPACPRQQKPELDITKLDFQIGYDDDGGRTIGVWGYFALREGYILKGHIETGDIDVAPGCREAILGEAMAEGNAKLKARLRNILLERVAKCRGIQNGECWALGTAGFREAMKALR